AHVARIAQPLVGQDALRAAAAIRLGRQPGALLADQAAEARAGDPLPGPAGCPRELDRAAAAASVAETTHPADLPHPRVGHAARGRSPARLESASFVPRRQARAR